MKFISTASMLLCISLSYAYPLPLDRRGLDADTQDDVLNGVCKSHTVIFARGTHAPGNVGDTAGRPFFQAIASLVGAEDLAVQGVNYKAGVWGFLQGGDPQGSETAAKLVEQAFTQCPKTKLVLSGYSQGAQIIHNAAAKLSAEISAKISSGMYESRLMISGLTLEVVVFGDPKNGSAVGTVPASKTLIVCHDGDNICEGGIFPGDVHGNYSDDAPEAAQFVVTQAALKAD
ncbi:alpha/beta-Hydrolase [Diplocarpon rosae]|nr:alpha/beta-Hydrolase [Diplocarpon rosae]